MFSPLFLLSLERNDLLAVVTRHSSASGCFRHAKANPESLPQKLAEVRRRRQTLAPETATKRTRWATTKRTPWTTSEIEQRPIRRTRNVRKRTRERRIITRLAQDQIGVECGLLQVCRTQS